MYVYVCVYIYMYIYNNDTTTTTNDNHITVNKQTSGPINRTAGPGLHGPVQELVRAHGHRPRSIELYSITLCRSLVYRCIDL